MAIPFNQQRLWRDFISTIRIEKCRGQAVPGDDLLRAVEQEIGPLPADLRELFSAFSIPAVKRRGRPANHPAREEFGMKELDQRYSELLRRFQSEAGGSQPRGKASPSERAYQHLATTMSTSFGNIDWRALRNKHPAGRVDAFIARKMLQSIQRTLTPRSNGSFPLS
jgi:hypothetical protein